MRAGALALLLSSPAFAETTLTVAGSGGAIAIVKRLADDHAARTVGVTFRFPPSLGTSGGIAALGAGAIDLALLARPLSEAEATKGLVTVPLCRTPLVFVTARRNGAVSLSSKQLLAMLAQGIGTWPDGTAARIVLRPPIETDTVLLRLQIDGFSSAYASAKDVAGAPVAATDKENLDTIEASAGSFGWTGLATMRAEARQLAAIVLDGIDASADALATGRYPYAKPYYLAHRADASPATIAFVAHVKGPEAGAILRNLDCIP